MAIDGSITRAKSMSASARRSTTSEREKTNDKPTVPARLGHLLARKHRIERWAYKGRSSSITDSATTASALLGTASAQKRSESSHSQAGRILNIHLLQLSEQRQKVIEQNNFDQKLFANKQALKHKDNQSVLRTLNYVRKCCKYANANDDDDDKDSINPEIFLDDSAKKRSRSRSPTATPPTVRRALSANPRTQTSASMTETFLRHNRKHLGSSPINRKLTSSYTPTMTNASTTPVDDDSQKRHVQFRIHANGKHFTCQSAHVLRKSDSYNVEKQIIRNVASANGVRTLNSSPDTRTSSAPLVRTTTPADEPSSARRKEAAKPKRSLSRIRSARNSMEEFRRHPERFLSASNRYLPLLRRQALEVGSREPSGKHQKERSDSTKRQRMNISPPISRLSDGSDLAYDDAKSFLSDENEVSTPTRPPVWLEEGRKAIRKRHTTKKINLMDTAVDDETAEYRLALSRLREQEFARLQELIRTSPIEQILEPFSAIKTDEVISINQKQASVSPATPRPSRIPQLNDILQSIDSLRCSDAVDRRARRQIDIEKNRAKLGILIF